jgi:DNA-binding MarR family transcriptional regulator
MSDLAATLGVQPPTVTKMISRLAAQDYVERRASQGDGRQALVFLTERGRRAVDLIDRIWKRIEKDSLSGIDEKDRKRLRKLLRQVAQNLGAADRDSDHVADDEDGAAELPAP